MKITQRRALRRSVTIGAVTAVLVVLGVSPASPQVDPRAPVVPAAEPVADHYIVTLRGDPADATNTASALARFYRGSVERVFDHADGFVTTMSRDDAERLAANPAVASVEQDGLVHATAVQAPSPSWGLDRIDQHALPLDNSYGYAGDGTGVHAFVLDTAIRLAHQDFGGRATSGFDFYDNDPDANDTCGANSTGHGTHVAGIIGGSTYGVAKNVQLVAVRVLDCSGTGSTEGVAAGIDWVTQQVTDHPELKPAVINMSLGVNGSSPAITKAINGTVAAGVTVVVAAGNSLADACGSSPAGVPAAITVGATTTTDSRDTAYSNFGPCVDVFAPGTGIVSDWNTSNSASMTLSGTSMASPHVAGVAARILAAYPTASPADVAGAITAGATGGVVANAGTGSPNRLLYASLEPVPPPAAPVVSATPHLGKVSLAWDAPSSAGAISEYRVYRATSAGGEGLVPFATVTGAPGSVPPTVYDDTAVTIGSTYFYQVTAVSVFGEGARSAERAASPDAGVQVVGLNSGGGVVSQEVHGSVASPAVALGGLGTSSPAVASDASGSVVFVRGTDNALWWRRITPSGTTPWASLGGYVTSDPAAYATGSEAGVVVRGGDGGIYWIRLAGSIASATPTGYVGLGGLATSNPTVAVSGSTRFVVVRGMDGAAYFQRFSGTTPSGWSSAGGYTTSDIAVSADSFGGDGATLVTRGTDNSEFRQHVPVSGAASGWASLGGNVTSNAGLAFDGTNVHVFVRGSDGSMFVQRLTSVSSGTGWSSLGGYASSDPKATFDGNNVRVVVRSGDNRYWWQIPGTIGWTPLAGTYSSNPAISRAN